MLPQADRAEFLESSLRNLLTPLQFANNDIGMVEPKRGQWKARLVLLGIQCLDYLKVRFSSNVHCQNRYSVSNVLHPIDFDFLQRNNLPYAEHSHEDAYDFCVWCDVQKEIDKTVMTRPISGVPSNFRLKRRV